MTTRPLIDLVTTPLRDFWTEQDFDYLLQNKERLFALIAINKIPRTPDRPLDNTYIGEEDFVLVEQRQASAKDMHEFQMHPRDLPITGVAYQSLRSYVRNYVYAGRYALPPDWEQRFPDIAALYRGHVPELSDYPVAGD